MAGRFNHNNSTIRRIQADLRELQRDPSPEYYASPLEDNLLEWHFTIRGPPDTEFAGGIYHGRIILPPEYPLKPPSIVFLTPNGRFRVKQKICLSISAYHPEHWLPAWGIRLILEALISFLPTPAEGAVGSLNYSPTERRKMAAESRAWRCPICGNPEETLPKVDAEAAARAKGKYAKEIGQLHVTAPKSSGDASAGSAGSAGGGAGGSDSGAGGAAGGSTSTTATAPAAAPPAAASAPPSPVRQRAAHATAAAAAPAPAAPAAAPAAARAAAPTAARAVQQPPAPAAARPAGGAAEPPKGDTLLLVVAMALAAAILAILYRRWARDHL